MSEDHHPAPLAGKFVVLAVTGGIASYKSIDLARQLTLEGAEVQCVLTRNALSFVQPLPFQVLTGRAPIDKMFPIQGGRHPGDMPHISLTDLADQIVLAPATANAISKFARGYGDDFLSTLLLSARAPVIIAPAMNPRMWNSPAVIDNIRLLRSRGHIVIEPGVGRMARPEEGEGRGRMPEPADVLAEIHRVLLPRPDLAGRRLVVSAGPTRERWDAVRYLSNRSSGKMGFAIARTALARGAEVTLVSGPVSLPDPPGVKVIRIESAQEMHTAILEAWQGADAAIMAAAVADYRPARTTDDKIKKEEGGATLHLERTTDILAEMGASKGNRILVGFAAETGDLKANALRKLQDKKLDFIVANHVSGEDDAMGADASRAIIFNPSGGGEELPFQEKGLLAGKILDKLSRIWDKNT
ncbi:MAG: bifunctional phosphopantothenoylcysteine decarboxylase/phosphopantothenate--cysteine ligase CoaBC [Nitrospinaceae bacterium]|nr:bifunctional phosphopantothenoylcysteine decarboxylase/phosphopantothenate--cysteine ligase CoaBC [Nitrospinaceae bacterium]MBT3434668.1 bifunctional phosphopantothenoylcysteine decarboxylase/phosphopantothenate--cysteine ligase CoaBC [Nitrospinaceae bacterium]MBT3823330.1 bifunctional phosphopantothenoylcysteine decarboxylase/phosphopantothenate--cysteine ligase CoaBC [Nitrospinaceae bacterium]MBT4095918.1 bifunctional phosphopantothenoylcysteine decarboxylase/phosphopantothenate--cysteine l